MDIVAKRAETSDARHSFSAATFRKVLKGFEIGGLPYTEVQFQLRRLLATGASPGELREVLRRSELIEPLPEYAYREVQSLLDEAIEQGAAPQTDPAEAVDHEEELDPAALSAELAETRSALETEQTRAREAEEALSQRIASEEAVRSHLDATLRESERYQTELRAARHSLASRDKVTAQMRQILDERDAELRAARAEIERSLTNSNSLSGAARERLASQDTALAEMRQTLAERDAQLVAMQRQRAETQSDLQASRTQAASLVAELNTARRALELNGADRDAQLMALRQGQTKTNRELEEKLQAAQKRAEALRLDLQASHDIIAAANAQVAKLQAKLRDNDALIEKLNAYVKSEARRATQWQAVAQQRASEVPLILPRAEMPPRVKAAPAGAAPAEAALAGFTLNVRGRRWNFPAIPRAVWIGAAAIVLLATVIWSIVDRRPTPALSTPVAATPAPTPPGTTIRDCPTCPVLTVLPAGRFEQGSAASENNSAFEKPPHWVMIAHPMALSTNAVTVDEFRAFVAATGRDMQGCDTYDGAWRHRAENSWENPGFVQGGSHPVTCTSWNDAKAYAAWLSAKTGQRYRLPSASEWEYAARAGGAAAQPWDAEGSDACASANVADQSAAQRYPGWSVFACNDGFIQTSPVGSFKANSFGLNDMLGNVFQWTEDCWNADYKGAPVDGAARSDGNCAERELRGGSWFSNPSFVRANYRNHFGADYRTSSVGIRVARDISP
jgi:formylglycine-generating enzyme required for sulfatase activity